MDILDHPNSPTQQKSISIDWQHCVFEGFPVDGTKEKGEPDSYHITGTYWMADIDGRVHVSDINARAIGVDHQPDTIAEDVRNHLRYTVFNEPIEFM